MSKLILGSHVGMSAPDYFLGSVKEALSYGSSTFMFYTGAPQNTARKPLEDLKIPEGRKLMEENGINLQHLVVHAPYLINLANTLNDATFELGVSFLVSELQRTAAFGAEILVLHPGASLKAPLDLALNRLVEGLNLALAQDGTNVKIALETMAGKGSEVGRNFEEIRYVLDNVTNSYRLGVCLDTCHVNDAGYDVAQFDKLLQDFDDVIGLDRLSVVHVNDSKNPRGAQKDRHENLGYGTIGFETLSKIVNHERLINVPKILETPWFKGKPPYKEEIAMLKSQKYISAWRDEF